MPYEVSETEGFLINLLQDITNGCSRHRFYMGNAPPKVVACEGCQRVFKAKQKWRKFKELNGI